MNNSNLEILQEFLSVNPSNSDEIFNRFAALPRAVSSIGDKPLKRYVYIPGTLKTKVVLVAHLDTVWDKSYTKNILQNHPPVFTDGVFKSGNSNYGIGADDRAGCAMLWQLRDSGHSLLLVDGEEHGKIGAKYLKNSNPALFKELNNHCFMIEFDWKYTNECLFNQVHNTKKFKKYINDVFGFADSKTKGGSDLEVLCRNICGVNIGIGYRDIHSPKETLIFSEWENTLNKTRLFLSATQPKFKISVTARYFSFLKRCLNKILHLFKIQK